MTTIATLEIERKSGNYYLKFQSEMLEKFFRELSTKYYESPRLDSCPALNGTGILYRYYVARKLPDTPYDLSVSPDILNNLGWMRAKGVGEGISILCPVPMIDSITNKLAQRVTDNLQYLCEQAKHGGTNEVESRKVKHVEFTI